VWSVLGDILSAVENIPAYVLFGAETAINAVFSAIGTALTAVMALLPSMPDSPAVSGDWIGWLNWIYPVGQLLDGLAVLVTMWIAFLAVRYVLRLVRAL
jgi:hypothetical protein